MQGIACRVIDLYSVKPVDAATIADAATHTQHIVVVEDHCPHGGLADAVREALDSVKSRRATLTSLCVRDTPMSASPEELLRWAGIDAHSIVEAVKKIASQ